MKIFFIDLNTEAICRQAKLATKKFGTLSAKKLQTRLGELFNAKCVAELKAGKPHPLKGDHLGAFAVSLHGGHRLVFRPALSPAPTREDGAVDWEAVTEVIIVQIGDYHD
jgi:toxin HigB-1